MHGGVPYHCKNVCLICETYLSMNDLEILLTIHVQISNHVIKNEALDKNTAFKNFVLGIRITKEI